MRDAIAFHTFPLAGIEPMSASTARAFPRHTHDEYGIGVVDVRSLTLTTILKGPSDPEQTSVSRDGTRLYIANEDAGKASILEGM